MNIRCIIHIFQTKLGFCDRMRIAFVNGVGVKGSFQSFTGRTLKNTSELNTKRNIFTVELAAGVQCSDTAGSADAFLMNKMFGNVVMIPDILY